MDLKRCQNPNSFMSNMLFCCSIFYKMKLPLIVVMNKEDVADKVRVAEWMQDYEKLLVCKLYSGVQLRDGPQAGQELPLDVEQANGAHARRLLQ